MLSSQTLTVTIKPGFQIYTVYCKFLSFVRWRWGALRHDETHRDIKSDVHHTFPIELRSRVHLVLSFRDGNALWVDRFAEAYVHVTGEVLELPEGARDVEDLLSRMPDMCTLFSRRDPVAGVERKAVTLVHVPKRERKGTRVN